MNQPLYFLDVNIPMYAAGTDHPYKPACTWITREIAEGQLVVAIDTEIVQEILYRYGAIQQWAIAATMAQNLLDLVSTVYPVTESDIHKTIELFRLHAPQGPRARDLLHAAIMLNNGLTHILTTDEHFQRIEGITRLDPKSLYDSSHQK